MALEADGSVYAWGSNGSGQIGDGTTDTRTTPVHSEIPTGVRIVGISEGGSFSLALGADGKIYGWGTDDNGQLG
jgi:alpha-tubulin suppressor-like RCC1 family protein